MSVKTLTNPKFPKTTIDIERDPVYGGATIKQFEVGKTNPQSMVMGKTALNMFLEEIKKDGWS